MTKLTYSLSLFFLLCAGVIGPRHAQADPLPLRLEIDLQGIANYYDHPDTVSLETQVEEVMSSYIDDDLDLHWSTTQGVSNTEMSLRVTQTNTRRKFGFILEIRGDVLKRIRYRGARPDSVPLNGQEFTDDLIDALYEFLFEMSPNIEGASQFVHAETDDALDTVVELARPLNDESRLRYRPDKLDIRWDRPRRYLTYERTDTGSFEIPILLVPGGTRSARLRPHIFQSHKGDLPQAQFCIHRKMIANPSPGLVPAVRLLCPIEGQCAMEDAAPAGWADQNCEFQINHVAPQGLDWSWGVAYAATTKPESWTVPTLEVLFDRVENYPGRFVGFTEFVLRARTFEGLDADAFSAKVFANGVPILINGVSSEKRIRPFDTNRGLLFRFGLENLKFAGRKDGCEDLGVVLQFYRDGKPVGDEVILTRAYASLRDAPPREIATPYGPITWSGEYIAPGGRNENGIFLSSALFFIENPDSAASALARLNALRERLEGFEWTISADVLGLGLGLESVLNDNEELAVVGKIRPPLTVRDNGSAAYGLLVGVEEPSGQLQFSFNRQQRRALLRFLATQRAEHPEARSVVPEEPFVYAYSEERRTGPDWVCRER